MKITSIFIYILMGCTVLSGCDKSGDNADYVPGYDYSAGKPVEPDDKPDSVGTDEVKIISFNIRVGSGDQGTQNAWAIRSKGIAPMFIKENPTVFGLQEALKFQVDYVKNNVPGYDCIGVGRDDGGTKGEIMAMFWKKEIVELEKSGTFWLSATPDKVSKGWDAKYYRTATWGIFRVKETGKRFLYMNTHLDNSGSLARKNSILLICDKLKELNPEGYPAILSADFNSTTADAIFDPLKEIMNDARSDSPSTDNLNTYNAWGAGGAVIDHIFYSGFNPLRYHTVNERWNGVQYISDHFPIFAVLQFN